MCREYPFEKRVSLSSDLAAAVAWIATRSPEQVGPSPSSLYPLPYHRSQVNREREAIMAQMEQTAAAMWASGKCATWYSSADAHVQQVSLRYYLIVMCL